jgi:hypothetical protein
LFIVYSLLFIDDFHRFRGKMSGLDAPGLRVEVVGAIADVLHRSEGNVLVGDGDEVFGCIGRQHEGLATEIAECLRVGEIDMREVTLWKVGGKDF